MFDWFFAFAPAAQRDMPRDGIATIGGLIALWIAALTYRRNVRLKREGAARLVLAIERRTLLYPVGAEFEVELEQSDLVVNPALLQILRAA